MQRGWLIVGAILLGVGGGAALATGATYGLGLLAPGAIICVLALRRKPGPLLSVAQGAAALLALSCGATTLLIYRIATGWNGDVVEWVALVLIIPLSLQGFFEGRRLEDGARTSGSAE